MKPLLTHTSPPISPSASILLTLLFIALVEILLLGIRLQQPWTGMQLKIQGDTLVVASVAEHSPLAGKLNVGDQLQSLESYTDRIPLTKHLKVLPLSIPTYQELDALLTAQKRLHKAFSSDDTLTLITTKGSHIPFKPLVQTHLQDLPSAYWWLLIPNMIGLVLGVIVWIYKPRAPEAIFLLLASISHFIAESLFRLSISKEFYLPPELTTMLTSMEGACFYLFMGSLFAILCYYPNRVAPRWLLPVTFAMTTLLSLNYHFRWWPVPIHIYILPIIPVILYASWLFYIQWQRSSGNPVSRAAILMLQLSALLPAWLIVLIHALPLMIDYPPLLGDITVRAILVATFAGWAVGILRFRLFDMEYWWLKSVLWILGGSLVIVLDIILAGLFQTSASMSIGLAVIIAGFLYFPLRQWLVDKFIPTGHQPLQAFLPAFSKGMAKATSPAGFEQRWRETLQQRFQPLHWELLPILSPASSLSENGMHLMVPDIAGEQTYKLSGKQRATRLFNSADVKNTQALLEIARMANNASEARQQAILSERQRIMRDLHDSLGARLLTLTHKLSQPADREAAKQALMTLRDTIRLSLRNNPLHLNEQIADWRAEIAERAEAADVRLLWQPPTNTENLPLAPGLALEITQLLREAVSNALKHAAPAVLKLQFVIAGETLHIRIANDGKVSDPADWKRGTGLNSMHNRIGKLHGSIRFELCQQPRPHNRVTFSVPLDACAPDADNYPENSTAHPAKT